MIWPAEQRLTLRQERLKPLVDELETWMLTKRARPHLAALPRFPAAPSPVE